MGFVDSGKVALITGATVVLERPIVSVNSLAAFLPGPIGEV